MTTAAPWTAERSISLPEVTALVDTYAPDLRGQPIELLGEGWDNAVFVVGGQWVLRFVRRRVALPGIRREVAVLGAVAPLLSLEVPVPRCVGDDRHPVEPWPFTRGRLVEGRELAEVDLPAEARLAAARSVGEFLRVLHGRTVRDAAGAAALAGGVELAIDPLQRGWPRARLRQTREALEQLAVRRVWSPDPAVASLLDQAAELDEPATPPVLVHGDLHIRHVLVLAGRVSGVIDWGDLCLADPAVDLAIGFAAFDSGERAALFEAYGPVSDETELRARALAVRLSALLVDYAARDGRPVLLREALRGLDRACR